jgi:hypothetical protein
MDGVLDHEHALGPAEAAEGGVGRQVGAHRLAGDADVLDVVGVVGVEERTVHDRGGQVDGPPPVGEQVGGQRHQPAVVVEAGPVVGLERVTLAGDRHVVGAVETHPDRSVQQLRAQRGEAGERRGLGLLAAERTAHPWHLAHHLVRPDAQHAGDHLLGLGGVLRRRVHVHRLALAGDGQRGLGLQVEVVLGAVGEGGLDHVRGARQGLLDVATRDGVRLGQEALGLAGLRDREDGRQGLVAHVDQRERLARHLDRLGDDEGDGLAVVVHLVGGQDRLVVHDGADVHVAGDVVGEQHGLHAGQRQRLGCGAVGDRGVGVGRPQAEAVQHAGGLGQVVDVAGLAGRVLEAGLVLAQRTLRGVVHG